MKPERPSQLLRGFVSEAEFAAAIGKSVRTLRIWRNRRFGPAYTRIGRAIYYREEAIRSWLQTVEIEPRGRKQEAA